MRLLFAVSEADPFAKTGGLGDVGSALPKYLCNDNCDVRVIMPKYGSIAERYRAKMKKVSSFRVDLSWRKLYCGLEEIVHEGVHYYFIDNEHYFKRSGLYGYGDDAERSAFFCKAVLEALLHVEKFKPQVIHCNDWHTALIPVFLKEFYGHDPFYYEIKTVFTIHNLKYQGIFPAEAFEDVLSLHGHIEAWEKLSFEGGINFMKGALLYSDAITSVSPSYAREIQNPFFGERLDSVLRFRSGCLSGILNGLDYTQYDPETDKDLFENYSSSCWDKKGENKRRLQEMLQLPIRADVPMLTMVSRLIEQKGLDLLQHILEELLQEDVQMVILGAGDHGYEEGLRWIAGRFPEKMAACITYDDALARKVYAAGDLFLMPSKFEPCGLSQMIAMRYGNLPVVRETGGLRDTVIPYDKYTKTGNGFSFANYNAHELLFTIKDALLIYQEEPEVWRKLMDTAYKEDFSWDLAAHRYSELYQKIGVR